MCGSRSAPASTVSTVFSGLRPETSYTFSLWWQASYGGPWVEVTPAAVCTTTVAPLPAPTGLTCAELTHNSITFTWDAIDEADSYSAKLSFLNPGTIHQVTVTVNSGPQNGQSATTECSTRVLLAAPTVTCGAATTTTIEAKWRPSRLAARYQIRRTNPTPPTPAALGPQSAQGQAPGDGAGEGEVSGESAVSWTPWERPTAPPTCSRASSQ